MTGGSQSRGIKTGAVIFTPSRAVFCPRLISSPMNTWGRMRTNISTNVSTAWSLNCSSLPQRQPKWRRSTSRFSLDRFYRFDVIIIYILVKINQSLCSKNVKYFNEITIYFRFIPFDASTSDQNAMTASVTLQYKVVPDEIG